MNERAIPILVALIIQVAVWPCRFCKPTPAPLEPMLPPSFDWDLWMAGPLILWRYATRAPAVAELCIRGIIAHGAIILVVLNLLRLTIRNRQSRWHHLLRDSRPWLVSRHSLSVVLCQTSFFLRRSRLIVDNISGLSAPQPIHGCGVAFTSYDVYFTRGGCDLNFYNIIARPANAARFAALRDSAFCHDRSSRDAGFGCPLAASPEAHSSSILPSYSGLRHFECPL